MSHALGSHDLATLLSQQRFLRQQEQHVRAELLRLSRSCQRGLPEYRPVSPPPPQRPIERSKHGVPNADATARHMACEHMASGHSGRNSRVGNSTLRSISAAVSQKQRELQQQQQERLQNISQHQYVQGSMPCRGFPPRFVGAQAFDTSPYTFDEDNQWNCERLSRARRAATSPLNVPDHSRMLNRQPKRLSPQILPAAGVPSGFKKVGEDWAECRQRRQVLPPYAIESSLSGSLDRDSRQLLQEQQSSGRQQGTIHVAGDQGGYPSMDELPSTSPPALHFQTSEADWIPERQTYLGWLPRSNSVTRRLLDGQGPGATAALRGPPEASWAGPPVPPYAVEDDQERQLPDRQGRWPPPRRQKCFIPEVAAGKPSASKNDLGTLEFRQSLRAGNEPRSSGEKAAVTPGHPRFIKGSKQSSSCTNNRTTLSDDEKTLRKIGVNLSPRELYFFRKQPSLRKRQQSLIPRSTKNGRAVGTEKSASTEQLARNSSLSEHEFRRNLALSKQRCEGVRVEPLAEWSVPSWVKTFAVPTTSGHDQFPFGPTSTGAASNFQHDWFQFPNRNDDAYESLKGYNLKKTMGCGCRCCLLRAQRWTGRGVSEQPCCCCPCCSAWDPRAVAPSRAKADPSTGTDNKYLAKNASSGVPSALAEAKSKCPRCGKLSEVSSVSDAHPGAQALGHRGLTLEEAAPLCQACATYLACERERRREEGDPPLRDDVTTGNTTAEVDPTKFRNSGIRRQAAPCVGENLSPSRKIPSKADTSPSKMAPSQTDQRSVSAQQGLTNEDAAPDSSNLSLQLGEKPASRSVWESPRIVAKICLFLPLSKLLLVRRCNKTLLQAAQYRMRYVLYKSLHILLNQPAQESGERPVVVEGHHCPISADALVKLLGLNADEVETVRHGDLPPACPAEAATPRMEDTAAAIRRDRATMHSLKMKKDPVKPMRANQMCSEETASVPAPPMASSGGQLPKYVPCGSTKSEMERHVLLDEHMAVKQAYEEASLKNLLQADRKMELSSALRYDEAAGPAIPRSPLRQLSQK